MAAPRAWYFLGNQGGCKARLRDDAAEAAEVGPYMHTIAMVNHVFVDVLCVRRYKAEKPCGKFLSSNQYFRLNTTVPYSHFKSTQSSYLLSTARLLTMAIKNVIIIGVNFSDSFSR